MKKPQALASHEGDLPFSSTEATRAIAIQAAHRTIAKLALLPMLNQAGAQQLKILCQLVNEAELLELRKYEIMKRAGGEEDTTHPDPERAEQIARGDVSGLENKKKVETK